MTSVRRGRGSSDPRCWWCGMPIGLACPYRGDATELNLPPGAGVVVCTPACPKRPRGARVWRARTGEGAA